MVKVSSGLYSKPMTIINDDSRVVNKLEASLTDDARVVIYNHHLFLYKPLLFAAVSNAEKNVL